VAQPHAGEPGARARVGYGVEIAGFKAEETRAKSDLAQTVIGHPIDLDRIGKVEPRRQQIDGKIWPVRQHASKTGKRPDTAIGIVGEVGERRRQLRGAGGIRLLAQRPGVVEKRWRGERVCGNAQRGAG
jgi:hypothetical protein